MFDFGWSELMVIGVVALIAIPPKDLPKALKTAGMVMRRARSLAREFQSSVDEMIREAELDEVRRSVDQAVDVDFERTIRNAVDPEGEIGAGLAAPGLESWSVAAEVGGRPEEPGSDEPELPLVMPPGPGEPADPPGAAPAPGPALGSPEAPPEVPPEP